MINLTKIAKFSAKKMFQDLKLKSAETPFFCEAIQSEIKITKLFFQHIVYKNKETRSYKEIIERILIIPFIQDIITTGVFIEKREEENISFFQFSKNLKDWTFSVIIQKRTQQDDYILLSCFKDFNK